MSGYNSISKNSRRQSSGIFGYSGEEMKMITSTSNQNVKEVVQLRKKSKARSQAGVFLVEGIRMIQEAPREQLVKLYVTEGFYQRHKEELGIQIIGDSRGKQSHLRAADTEGRTFCAELVSDNVFEYMSDTKTPQGVLGIVKQAKYSLEEILGGNVTGTGSAVPKQAARGIHRSAPHLVALDNLQDPGNLGTIFRTAEAAGVTGIVMSKDCVDIYNPKTIRSTMGAIYRMPFLYAEDLEETVHTLKKNGIRVYAAHLDGKNSYDQEDYRGGTAFLIGNEGNGLRREIADSADAWIQIPMAGQAESLNAAVAAAILMFETSRQRRED